MRFKKVLRWALLAAFLSLASCSWLQDEYFFTYSRDPGLHRGTVAGHVLPFKP